MTKKRRTGLAIGAAVACIAVLCAAGACNGVAKEEKVVRRVTVTTLATTSQATEPVSSTTQPTSTVPVTATAESIAVTTAPPQITTAVTCATDETTALEQGLGETPTPTTTTEQTAATDTTVQLTTTQMATTAAPAVTTAPPPTEPYNGQTSGDYNYCIGFGWIFNEGGGGEGSVNYEMYCNGNKIGYFG